LIGPSPGQVLTEIKCVQTNFRNLNLAGCAFWTSKFEDVFLAKPVYLQVTLGCQIKVSTLWINVTIFIFDIRTLILGINLLVENYFITALCSAQHVILIFGYCFSIFLMVLS
jgi:hypothetical protein